MSRCLYFLLLLACTFSACSGHDVAHPIKKNNDPVDKEEPTTITASSPVPKDTLSQQKAPTQIVFKQHYDPFTSLSGFQQTSFTIKASRDTMIRTSSGLRLLIRSNTFARNEKPVKGTVQVQITEMPLAETEIAGKQLSYLLRVDAFKGKTPLSIQGAIFCGLPDAMAQQQKDFYMLWGDETPRWNRLYPYSYIGPVTSAVPVMREAEFPGGQEAMKRFLLAQTELPADIAEISGMLFVELTISEFGEVKGARVTKPLNDALDASVLRAVQRMPLWRPASTGLESDPSVYSIPVEVKNGSISFRDAVSTWQRPEREEVFRIFETGVIGIE